MIGLPVSLWPSWDPTARLVVIDLSQNAPTLSDTHPGAPMDYFRRFTFLVRSANV
jgi:hypothetical protein